MIDIDTIIIGAGPAGLQLGYFLQKGNHEYLILERNEVEYNYYENGTRYIVNKSKPHWRVIKAEKDRLAALAAYNKTWKEGQKKTPVAPAKEGGRFTRKQRKTRISRKQRKTRKQRNNK